MSGALVDVGKMFGAGGLPLWSGDTAYRLGSYALVLILGAFGSTPILKNTVLKLKENSKVNNVFNILEPIFHVAILLIVTAYFVDGSFSPFLYFRF